MRQETATCESKLKNAGNLGAIRALENSMPQIRQEVKDAIQPVKDLLGDVFSLETPIQDFIKKHWLERHYMFSVKRCGEDDCVCGRPRLPKEIFNELHHLPDPAPSPTEGDKFMHFEVDNTLILLLQYFEILFSISAYGV